jgi:hypothetical protein
MKEILKDKWIFIVGGILILIFAGLVMVLLNIGQAYKKGLADISNQNPPKQITHIVKDRLKKITIKKQGEEDCIEVNSDGVVRIYSVCGKELQDARRLTDLRYVDRLFKTASETDLTAKGETEICIGYEMTVETDSGQINTCLPPGGGSGGNSGGGGNGNGGGIGDIIDIIEKIKEDIPPLTPTPTEAQHSPTPTLPPGVTPTPTIPGGTITPTPTPVGYVPVPFSCDFTNKKDKKNPFYISNIICSSEPTPYP